MQPYSLPAYIQNKKDWNWQAEMATTGNTPAYRPISRIRRIETDKLKEKALLAHSLPAYIQNKKDWNEDTKQKAKDAAELTGLYPE